MTQFRLQLPQWNRARKPPVTTNDSERDKPGMNRDEAQHGRVVKSWNGGLVEALKGQSVESAKLCRLLLY